MQLRAFTSTEQGGLSAAQKKYLIAHPGMVSLQPGSMLRPSEQLYQSLLYGAVTIDRAIELDAIRSRVKSEPEVGPVFDNYTDAEDRFIDDHGMSIGLG